MSLYHGTLSDRILAAAAAGSAHSLQDVVTLINVLPRAESEATLTTVLSLGWSALGPPAAVAANRSDLLALYPRPLIFDALEPLLRMACARGDMAALEWCLTHVGPSTMGRAHWNNLLRSDAHNQSDPGILDWLHNVAKNAKLTLSWANRDWGGLAKTGSLSSLQWARAKGYLKQNFRSVLLFAGAAGHVTILSWWWAGASADRDTALKLLYASSALERASQYGRAAVLVWWSSLFCSPTSTPRDPLPDAWDLSTITHAAVQGGHLLAAKWWWAYVLAARDQEDLQFGNDNSATSALEAGVAGEMLDWLWRISHSPRRHLVAFASQWPAPGVELPSYLVSGCVPSIDSLAWLQAKMLDPKIKMPFVWGEAETQCCCETGAVDVLEWVWQRKSTLRATWATTIAQTATQYGKALVLDWWWPIREQLPTQVRASTDVFVERAKAADLETLRWWSDRTRFDAKTWRMIGAGAAESGCPDLTHWWQSQASCLRPGEVRAGIKLALQSATTIRVLTMLHEMAFSHKVPLPALSEVLSSTQRSMTLVQLDYWCTVHGAKRAELLRAAPKALMAALEQSNFKILEWWIAQHASLGAKVTFNNLDQLSMHSLNYLKREWIDDVMVNRGIELFANDEWSMAVVKFTPQASAGPNTWY